MPTAKFKPVDEQFAYLKKGSAEIIREEELKAKLAKSLESGVPLRVYLGVDPTAPDLHLGHTVVLRKLKHFQDMGHTAVFLIGDFSAMIGDPTGVSETRPPLTREQVDANAKTYLEQVFKILDREKTEVRYNSHWLNKKTAVDVVRLCSHYRLARMLEREDFRSRLKNEQPISVHELLYPLLTALDAVEIQSDVEIGATEQKFNLLVHRDIQITYKRIAALEKQLENPSVPVEYHRSGQACLTMPILVGTDGERKMSKSLGNYIGITEPPNEMYGKIMSLPDQLMWSYFDLVTDKTPSDIDSLRRDVVQNGRNPRDVKMILADAVVRGFHGADAAIAASQHFERVYTQRLAPEEVPIKKIARSGPTRISTLVFICDLTTSRSEAERLIKQKAVEIDGVVIDDPRKEVDLSNPGEFLLRAGKKKFVRIVII